MEYIQIQKCVKFTKKVFINALFEIFEFIFLVISVHFLAVVVFEYNVE